MVKKTLAKSAAKVGSNRALSILAITTVFLVSVSFVLSRGLVGDIRFNSQVQSRKNQVNSTLEKNLATLPALQENFKSLSQNGPRPADVLDALPVGVDYDGLARDFETMAALSGVQLTGISLDNAPLGESAAANTPQSVSFQASASGSYSGLIQFLQNLEIFARPTVFNLLTFSGNEPTLTLELGFTTYWQPVSEISDQTEEFNEN